VAFSIRLTTTKAEYFSVSVWTIVGRQIITDCLGRDELEPDKKHSNFVCNTPYFLDQKVIICLKRLILLDIPVRVVPLISVI
jgi:hypothetical protein